MRIGFVSMCVALGLAGCATPTDVASVKTELVDRCNRLDQSVGSIQEALQQIQSSLHELQVSVGSNSNEETARDLSDSVAEIREKAFELGKDVHRIQRASFRPYAERLARFAWEGRLPVADASELGEAWIETLGEWPKQLPLAPASLSDCDPAEALADGRLELLFGQGFLPFGREPRVVSLAIQWERQLVFPLRAEVRLSEESSLPELWEDQGVSLRIKILSRDESKMIAELSVVLREVSCAPSELHGHVSGRVDEAGDFVRWFEIELNEIPGRLGQ